MANTKICSEARSKELDILCLMMRDMLSFVLSCIYNIHVITVVIVAVVVPSLCFRSVERV